MLPCLLWNDTKYYITVKGTTVEVKGLKAETEYIFQVAAVRESNGQTIIGRKSRGTNLTTPKEWYYSCSAYTNKDKVWVYNYYKENYSKTKHEEITLEGLGGVEEFFYYHGWIYFISQVPKPHDDMGIAAGLPSMYYIGRIKEDGTAKEVLFNKIGNSEGYFYSYKVYDDHIYIHRGYNDFGDGGYGKIITYMSDYHRISLKTGEVSKICDIYVSSGYDICGDYMYFVYYPQEYNEEAKGYADI